MPCLLFRTLQFDLYFCCLLLLQTRWGKYSEISFDSHRNFRKYLIYLRFERTEMIKLLLERGADPLIATEIQTSPLDSAVRTSLVEICVLLLEDQRVKNYLNQGNLKPLLLACYEGRREVCELLLRYGADFTRTVFGGSTPLQIAAFQGHEDVCELFIETGNITYEKMKISNG